MEAMTVGRRKLMDELRKCTLVELAQRLRRKDPGCKVSKSSLCLIRSGKRLPSLRLANAFAAVLLIACYEWFQKA